MLIFVKPPFAPDFISQLPPEMFFCQSILFFLRARTELDCLRGWRCLHPGAPPAHRGRPGAAGAQEGGLGGQGWRQGSIRLGLTLDNPNLVCLFVDGPVSRPTTHSQNCWLQSNFAETAFWVLAQVGIHSPCLMHCCDLERPLLRYDRVRPCLATLALSLFLAYGSHQLFLANSKSYVERNPPQS